MLSKLALVLAVATSSVSGLQLAINNWCYDDMHVAQANPAVCGNADADMNGNCGDYNTIAGSNGAGNLQFFNIIANGDGTSVKMSRAANGYSGIMQYEYTMNETPQYGGFYWDLSMLDGDGASRTGSPWYNDNVKVSPTGDSSGSGTCIKYRCTAGQVCEDAYQTPSQTATRFCPTDTGDMYIDLCEPQPEFSNRRREIAERFERRAVIARDQLPGGVGVGGLHDLVYNATHGIHS